MNRSTLLTSPASFVDFLARLAYFALAPVGIILAALLFPVTGTLVSIAVALVILVAAETVRGWASKSWIVRKLTDRELAMEQFYKQHPPRRFLYYVFYPLLFPYWLYNREARREFWFFKGYTAMGAVILIASTVWQYFRSFPPQLGLRQFLPILAASLAVEFLLVLGLLMPIATTVIWCHQTFRRGRLIALLVVGLLSTSVGIARVMHKRDPVVSFATRHRVRQRTQANPVAARAVQLDALRGAWGELQRSKQPIEGDGKVQGEALEHAQQVLERFYKHDEAYAFDLWASPRSRPRVLVLYFEAREGHRPMWVALRDGAEVTSGKQLPKGAFSAMKHAAEE